MSEQIPISHAAGSWFWFIKAIIIIIVGGIVGIGGAWYWKNYHALLSTAVAHSSEVTSTNSASPVKAPTETEKLVAQFELLKMRAESGDVQAQFELGQCYEKGEGTTVNDQLALRWIEKAANLDNSLAQLAMGHRLYDGTGVEQNYVRAAAYFQLAGQSGLAEAQCWAGFCFEYNRGVKERGYDAYGWYMQSAQQGYAPAQYSLARNASNLLTHAQCASWCLKAAQGDLPVAQTAMGIRYTDGDGVNVDYFKAVKWLQKGAEHDHAIAYWYLGFLNKKGLGVQRNRTAALTMFEKAIALGYKTNKTAVQLVDDNPQQRIIVNGVEITTPSP